MSQKLLAYLFYGFLVLMVVAALFLLKYQLDQKDVKQQQIDSRANLVSRLDSEAIVKPALQQQANQVNSQTTISQQLESQPTQESADQPLTYLQVYRQLQKVQACQPYFRKWQAEGIKADLTNIVRPATRLFGAPDYLPTEPQPISAGQQTMLNQWQAICLNLWHEYGVFSLERTDLPTLVNDISTDIERFLNTLPTKTAKEIAIKNARKIAVQWQQSYKNLEQTLVGEDSVDEAQLLAWREEIERLKTLRTQISKEFRTIDNPSDEETNNMIEQQMELYEQITAIEKQITAQKAVNKDALAQAETAFESQNQALNKLLYGRDGDVFFEALRTLEGQQSNRITTIGFNYNRFGKANSYRVSPDQMVLENSQWQSTHTQSNTLKYAAHLYLCDIGWDCSSESIIMLQYCLFDVYTHPDACGLDLRTFYQRHLISTNHMMDIRYFKNIYTDLFYE